MLDFGAPGLVLLKFFQLLCFPKSSHKVEKKFTKSTWIFKKLHELMKKKMSFNKKGEWKKNDQNALVWSGPGNKMEAFEASS